MNKYVITVSGEMNDDDFMVVAPGDYCVCVHDADEWDMSDIGDEPDPILVVDLYDPAELRKLADMLEGKS